MARRKARKGKTDNNPDAQTKIDKLNKLLSNFKTQANEYENYLNGLCEQRCNDIKKIYVDQLNGIPENIRNMTFSEVLELEEKAKARVTECPKNENAIRMKFERQKMTSEKKRTQRKEKKRSISAPASARGLSNSRHPGLSRTASDLSLTTPVNRHKKVVKAITPKFNPECGIAFARNSKPQEILMSVSGSPVRNYIDDLPPDKPAAKLILSSGQGKVITFNGEKEIETESEFLKTIDEPMKNTLKDLQRQLNKILNNK